MGNLVIAAAGALPLLYLAASATPPAGLAATRTVAVARATVGDAVEVEIRLPPARRRGLLEVHQALPAPFALAGDASNFRVVAARSRDGERTLRFAFLAAKRGLHALPPVTLRWIDPLGLVEHAPLPLGEGLLLEVLPRASHRTTLRDVRARATRPVPEADYARFGLPTTEFREIRDYAVGDPIRSINWKATARRLASGTNEVPLVNQYEFEGKKTVWLLVDGHPTLEIGDTVRDAREFAIDAGLGLAETFLRRGFQVGASTFRAAHADPLYAEAGEGQIGRIRTLFARVAPAPGPSLADALERIAPFAASRRPLFVVFTRLDRDDEALLQGLRRARAFQGLRPRGASAVVVDVQPWTLYGNGDGGAAARRERRLERAEAARHARAAGALVLEWDPGATPFEAVVSRKGVV